MNAKFIDSWKAYTEGITSLIATALEAGDIESDDTVWGGADGSYVIGDVVDWAETEDIDADLYADRGTVAEYLAAEE